MGQFQRGVKFYAGFFFTELAPVNIKPFPQPMPNTKGATQNPLPLSKP